MQIKATRPVSIGSGVCLGVGQTATVPDDVAALLITMGKAVRVYPSSVVEKPVVPVIEKGPVIETASIAPNKSATRKKK